MALLGLACSGAVEVVPREAIALGPWTFEVERADARTDVRGGDRWRTIAVHLRLHNWRERHEQTFDDFLNGNTPGAIMCFPKLKLCDVEGTLFDGLVRPGSGGSLRSERWTAEFLLVPGDLQHALADASELAKRYLDKKPADFRLLIENPDRRRGQPRRVSVQLP